MSGILSPTCRLCPPPTDRRDAAQRPDPPFWSARSSVLRVVRTMTEIAYRLYTRGTLAACDQCIFTNEQLATYFKTHIKFAGTPQCILNGIDPTVFYPVSAGGQCVTTRVWVAQRSARHTFRGAVCCAERAATLEGLATELPECSWVFLGWGPDSPTRWGLANVACPGAIDHEKIADYYRAADLVVVPSLVEGGSPPLVVVEAMSCGTPVLLAKEIATGPPGIEQVAYVARLDKNEMVAMVRSVVRQIGNQDDRRASVARFATHFSSWDTAVDHYERLFRRVHVTAGRRLGTPARALSPP